MSATTLATDYEVGRPAVEDDGSYFDEQELAPKTRPASFAAGMAFCIPALSLLGVLYTLLK